MRECSVFDSIDPEQHPRPAQHFAHLQCGQRRSRLVGIDQEAQVVQKRRAGSSLRLVVSKSFDVVAVQADKHLFSQALARCQCGCSSVGTLARSTAPPPAVHFPGGVCEDRFVDNRQIPLVGSHLLAC